MKYRTLGRTGLRVSVVGLGTWQFGGEWGRDYTMYHNVQPEVDSGCVVRALPLDLSLPLPIALRPAETVEVDFLAGESGKLGAETEDGSPLEIAIDGGASGHAPRVEVGRHRATVKNPGARVAWFRSSSSRSSLGTSKIPP